MGWGILTRNRLSLRMRLNLSAFHFSQLCGHCRPFYDVTARSELVRQTPVTVSYTMKSIVAAPEMEKMKIQGYILCISIISPPPTPSLRLIYFKILTPKDVFLRPSSRFLYNFTPLFFPLFHFPPILIFSQRPSPRPYFA